MVKNLNEIQVGDKVARKGGVKFDRPFEVTEVSRIDGAIYMVKLEGGRFWPFSPSIDRALATEIEVVA